MPGVGRAGGEVLDDPVAEVRVGQEPVRVLARRGRLDEGPEGLAVVDRLGDEDVADAILVLRVEAADEGHVERSVTADRGVDVRRRGRGRAGGRDGDGLGERRPPVA